jgi:mono/diheme cytochrome c family protein
MKAALRALLLLSGIAIVTGGVAVYTVASRGLSTRVQPSALETWMAHAMRWLATPASVRSAANPVEATPDVLEEGLAHFADHCATCHANDGSGDSPMGRSFYPPAPDMRVARTQQLTDGELFSIIEHGIRLTGMPAWGTGTPEGQRASWALVHFMRRLPTLTEDEIARMEQLNPQTAEQWREEEEARRFLAGEDVKPAPAAPHKHDGSR